MTLKIYQADAFTNKLSGGNPATVCLLTDWLPEELMQKIAMENNLAETAFLVKANNTYHIRWFTPTVEVDLCGHATLAAAFVLFNFEQHNEDIVHFYSHRSGALSVVKENEWLTLNFPVDIPEPAFTPANANLLFNISPFEVFKGKTDYLFVFDSETHIRQLRPRFPEIAKLKARGVIVTAKGEEVDFVSRFFGPRSGIDEDPVTGSAHTTLIPFWAERLAKKELSALQLSARKGYLECKLLGDRVAISGQARLLFNRNYLPGLMQLFSTSGTCWQKAGFEK
ncbi:MAG: PhzF family phenazine biosynthesis protein [Niabella sp.]